MKVGVSEWSLHQNFGRTVKPPTPMNVMQFIDLAGRWKADGLQIESVPDDEKAVAEIRSRAEKLGLYIEVEAGGLKPERIAKKLQAAKLLGAKVLRTFPAIDRYRKDIPLGRQLKTAEENLRQIAAAAEKLNILVGVENHQNLVIDKVEKQDITGAELAELLDRVDSPFVGVCLDTGNAIGLLEDPMEAAKMLAPRTVTVHLKDYRIKRTFRGAEFAGCALGRGSIDLSAILRLLRERSPLGDNLCLNVEAAVERISVPFLDPEFWDGYAPGDAARVPAYLRFIRDHGEPPETDFRMPVEQGRTLDEVLAHECECNRESIAYARKLLAAL